MYLALVKEHNKFPLSILTLIFENPIVGLDESKRLGVVFPEFQ
jgi:hypothetical protein